MKYDSKGLVVAIAQDRLTGEVRMVAWMNQAALDQTLATGRATFFSRSRDRLWKKGETSGHELLVHDVHVDCDGDSILLLVDPIGPSCHTGRRSCFFQPLPALHTVGANEDQPGDAPATPFLQDLEAVLEARRTSSTEKSYTKSLLEAGADKIGAKVVEEAGEYATAIASESDDRVASEAADVIYHLMVGLRHRNLPWRAVLDALASRLGTSGHTEKARRSPKSSTE